LLLAAAGLGLASALIYRALNPPPPRYRAVRLLQDLRHRLADLTHPAYDRVSELLDDSAHAVSRGAQRGFGRLGRGVKQILH
jgi:hypothetical protein